MHIQRNVHHLTHRKSLSSLFFGILVTATFALPCLHKHSRRTSEILWSINGTLPCRKNAFLISFCRVMVVRGLLHCTLAFLILGLSGDFRSALFHRLAHKLSPPRIQRCSSTSVITSLNMREILPTAHPSKEMGFPAALEFWQNEAVLQLLQHTSVWLSAETLKLFFLT